MSDPTVVISLDLELSWGMFDLSFDDHLLKMARWTHDVGAPNLLNHLTSNGLSATWAAVGAMMRPSLPDVSGLPEVNYPHFAKPWFSYVPKEGDELTHPEWFGASLIQMIKNAKPEQEIGFHSFSHVPFRCRGMTREQQSRISILRPDRQRARNPNDQFRFPAEFGCLRLLNFAMKDSLAIVTADELPVRCNKRQADIAGHDPGRFRRTGSRMIEPSLREGIISIPGSLLIRYEAGWRKYIPDSSRLRRLRKGLDARAGKAASSTSGSTPKICMQSGRDLKMLSPAF